MFKIASAFNSAGFKEASDICEKIRTERPDFWPFGLSPSHFDGGLYLVKDSRTNKSVGFVGWQQRLEKENNRRIKVGFYSLGILPEYRGNGFAKEAISKLISIKAAGVDQVRALIMSHNEPSKALARSLGVPMQIKVAAALAHDLAQKGGDALFHYAKEHDPNRPDWKWGLSQAVIDPAIAAGTLGTLVPLLNLAGNSRPPPVGEAALKPSARPNNIDRPGESDGAYRRRMDAEDLAHGKSLLPQNLTGSSGQTLHRLLRRKGIDTDSTENRVPYDWKSSPARRKLFIALNPGEYKPGNKTITTSERFTHPAILAHEAGHALGPKALLVGNALGKLAGPLLESQVLMSRDPDKARHWAEASSASMLPMLYSEADASLRGSNILARLGQKGLLNRLRPFAGFPSYLALAASPWAAYGVKKHFGGYNGQDAWENIKRRFAG